MKLTLCADTGWCRDVPRDHKIGRVFDHFISGIAHAKSAYRWASEDGHASTRFLNEREHRQFLDDNEIEAETTVDSSNIDDPIIASNVMAINMQGRKVYLLLLCDRRPETRNRYRQALYAQNPDHAFELVMTYA